MALLTGRGSNLRALLPASFRSGPKSQTYVRLASSKHPTGFVPPTRDDLGELRERVQDFIGEHEANTVIDEFGNDRWTKGEKYPKSLLRRQIVKMSSRTRCGGNLGVLGKDCM